MWFIDKLENKFIFRDWYEWLIIDIVYDWVLIWIFCFL